MKKVWTYSKYKKRLARMNFELYDQYDSIHGFSSRIQQERFYKEFVHPIKIPSQLKFKVPSFIFPGSIDYDFLLKLIASSFSSSYDFVYPSFFNVDDSDSLQAELYITVTSKGATVTKGLHELFDYQIIRLFDIYVSELMGLYLLYKDVECPNPVSTGYMERRILFEKKAGEFINRIERNKILFDLRNSRENTNTP